MQSVMLAALLLYYFHPPALGFFKFLARLKTDWGYGYSIVSSAIAGAVLPEILRIIAFQRGNFRCKNFTNLCFAVPFWSAMGLCVDLLYRSQATWFGADASFPIVLKKVLVDQFLYNPLFSAPVTTWLYHWKQTGYSSQAMNGFLSSAYYRERILPTLFATWGVWIPVVTILY